MIQIEIRKISSLHVKQAKDSSSGELYIGETIQNFQKDAIQPNTWIKNLKHSFEWYIA